MLILSGLALVRPPAVSALATFGNPVDKETQTNCDPFETPTQIKGGSNDGKWYCKAKNAPQPAKGSIDPSAPGCNGDSSQCGSTCGGGDTAYTPVIDIGCQGKGNAIMDSLFGIIRFLSDGVGLVVVGSIIVGGIQYSASRGDPQSTALAINRIRSSLIALLIYIFAYAFLNYLLPGFVL